MIPEIVASIILLVSLAGLIYLVGKKVPVLLTFPAQEEGQSPKDLVQKVGQQLRSSKRLRHVTSPELMLQTLLSKARIAALKTENKTGQILENLRKKSQEKDSNSKFSDDKYWKDLKKKR
tara:strand:- start:655 stop:1014 length:360 start_codon:yes stop_codon:yes gene_type:complete